MTDLKTMTDDELERHVFRLYGDWMHHEAAERGYDFDAADAARRVLWEAEAEQAWRRSRAMAEPACAVIGLLTGNPEE